MANSSEPPPAFPLRWYPDQIVPPAIFSSPRAAARIARASAWLAEGGRDRETLVIGATALAARTPVRQVTATGGAIWVAVTTTLGGLAVSLAMPTLVDAQVAAAGATIVEALSVRALHRLREVGGLGRLAIITDRPGLAPAPWPKQSSTFAWPGLNLRSSVRTRPISPQS